MNQLAKSEFEVLESDQRVIIPNVQWDTYQRLLKDIGNAAAPRFFYHKGVLEIMSPSYKHGKLADILSDLIKKLAEMTGLEYESFHPVTFRREDRERGFEPDAGFYIQNAAKMIGKEVLDLSTDPSPDLVVEIDLSHDSSDKFPIYATLGIPEVWRYSRNALIFHRLVEESYVSQDRNAAFPFVPAGLLQEYMELGLKVGRLQLLRQFRERLQPLLSR